MIEENDLIIKVPSFYFENLNDRESLNFFIGRLSDCLLDYKRTFGIEPNEIKFCGKQGSLLYNIFNDMLSSVYTCSKKDYGDNCLIFSNKDTKTQNQTQQRGIKNVSNFSGKMVEGFAVPDMSSYLSFSYDMEKDVKTEKEYSIEIL